MNDFLSYGEVGAVLIALVIVLGLVTRLEKLRNSVIYKDVFEEFKVGLDNRLLKIEEMQDEMRRDIKEVLLLGRKHYGNTHEHG